MNIWRGMFQEGQQLQEKPQGSKEYGCCTVSRGRVVGGENREEMAGDGGSWMALEAIVRTSPFTLIETGRHCTCGEADLQS